jgi:hypothetical protein
MKSIVVLFAILSYIQCEEVCTQVGYVYDDLVTVTCNRGRLIEHPDSNKALKRIIHLKCCSEIVTDDEPFMMGYVDKDGSHYDCINAYSCPSRYNIINGRCCKKK